MSNTSVDWTAAASALAASAGASVPAVGGRRGKGIIILAPWSHLFFRFFLMKSLKASDENALLTPLAAATIIMTYVAAGANPQYGTSI